VRAGEPLDDLEPAVQSCEREHARRGRARGEDDEPAAGAARAGVGHQRDARGGAPDELHPPQVEDDQRGVGLGGAQRSVGASRGCEVEAAGKDHLDDAEPEVVGDAAKP
jgi:hypothetical protein